MFLPKTEGVDQLLDHLQEVGQLPRLRDHVMQVTVIDGLDQVLRLGEPGDHGAAAQRPELGDPRQELGARQPWHAQVRKHTGHFGILLDVFQRLQAIVGQQDREFSTEDTGERPQIVELVIDADDDRLGCVVGCWLFGVNDRQRAGSIGLAVRAVKGFAQRVTRL